MIQPITDPLTKYCQTPNHSGGVGEWDLVCTLQKRGTDKQVRLHVIVQGHAGSGTEVVVVVVRGGGGFEITNP
jgi:hypothetical protein